MESMSNLNCYVATFNCGRSLLDVDHFAASFFDGIKSQLPPDLVVLALEEIAPIAYSFLGGEWLDPYFARFFTSVNDAASLKFDSVLSGTRHILTWILCRRLISDVPAAVVQCNGGISAGSRPKTYDPVTALPRRSWTPSRKVELYVDIYDANGKQMDPSQPDCWHLYRTLGSQLKREQIQDTSTSTRRSTSCLYE